MRIRALAFCFLFLSFSGNAADLTVFGFSLGQPLPLDECQKESWGGYKILDQKVACMQRVIQFHGMDMQKILFPMSKTPSIMLGCFVDITVIDGKVEEFSFPTAGLDYRDKVRVALNEKYGKPTRVIPNNKENLFGVKVKSSIIIWEFPEYVVTFVEVTDQIDHGKVKIVSPVASAAHRRADQETEADNPKL